MTLAVSIAQSGANNVTMRNRIINGAMMIDQRANGTQTNSGGILWSCDRWRFDGDVASKMTSQLSSTAPAGFNKSILITSLSSYSVGASENFAVSQQIEGYNTADFGWGTANAKTITLSFWVQSSLTGNFGGCINNEGNTRSYAFSYTINNANTWEYKTVTIAGDTSGTWATTNGRGLIVRMGLGNGSAISTTAGSWQTGFYAAPTGAVSVVSTNGATWYITGVQLEAGTTATPFEQRLYGTELALCQRYYWKTYNIDVAPGTIASEGSMSFPSTGGLNRPVVPTSFKVSMRANPTITTYSPNTGASGKCRNDNAGTDQNTAAGNTGANGTVWYPSVTTVLSDSFSAHIVASAEL